MNTDYHYGFTFYVIFSAGDNGWGCCAYRFDDDEFFDLGKFLTREEAVDFFHSRGLDYTVRVGKY